MRWLDWSTDNCSVARALDLVGDRWTLQILRDAYNGVRRFDELHRHLEISPTVLTARLAHLVERGVLTRRPYQQDGTRTRHEYRLTAMGRDLYPVVIAMMNFGDAYLADEAGPPVLLEHADCGAPVAVTLTCTQGHLIDSARDVRAIPGPGAKPVS